MEYPIVPWKDDSSKEDTVTYSFEGYALSKSATGVLKLDNYKVVSDMELYAIFKEKSVYNNVHHDYWNYDLVDNAYMDNNDPVTDFHIKKGYVITPKPEKKLRGKITIPAEYNGYPVYKIQNEAFSNDLDITHVFIEPDSKLRWIGTRAFNASHIRHFEFTDSLRIIDEEAFSQASKLEPDKTGSYFFGDNLYIMGMRAFSQALNFNGNSATIYLPPSLQAMGYYAISNLANSEPGSEILIGTPSEPSKLDLSRILGAASSANYKVINHTRASNHFTITFYSKLYNSASDQVYLAAHDVSYSVEQMLGIESSGITSVTVVKGG